MGGRQESNTLSENMIYLKKTNQIGVSQISEQ